MTRNADAFPAQRIVHHPHRNTGIHRQTVCELRWGRLTGAALIGLKPGEGGNHFGGLPVRLPESTVDADGFGRPGGAYFREALRRREDLLAERSGWVQEKGQQHQQGEGSGQLHSHHTPHIVPVADC